MIQAMPTLTLSEFRDTLRVLPLNADTSTKELYIYCGEMGTASHPENTEELLHILHTKDGRYILEIANLCFIDELPVLEEALYNWAKDEGWFA